MTPLLLAAATLRVALRAVPGRREIVGVETVLRWIVAEMVVRPSRSSYTESEEPSVSEAYHKPEAPST